MWQDFYLWPWAVILAYFLFDENGHKQAYRLWYRRTAFVDSDPKWSRRALTGLLSGHSKGPPTFGVRVTTSEVRRYRFVFPLTSEARRRAPTI
jgi:hypothetical protein